MHGNQGHKYISVRVCIVRKKMEITRVCVCVCVCSFHLYPLLKVTLKKNKNIVTTMLECLNHVFEFFQFCVLICID